MAEGGYRKTLNEVASVSGQDVVDAVADYIKDQIRENEDRPTNRSVRKQARDYLADVGDPSTPYLNRA